MLRRSLVLLPARRPLYQAKLGIYVLIASLGVFFLASLIAYAVIRTTSMGPDAVRLRVPVSFYLSTIVLVGVSLLLHRAVQHVHHERQKPFRRCLIGATLLAVAFLVHQCVGMTQLLQTHFSDPSGNTQNYKLYGISFTLALIHALHVLGGMIFLAIVLVKGSMNKYDHERHWAVDICASYWHFLDAVWIIMLGTFVVIG